MRDLSHEGTSGSEYGRVSKIMLAVGLGAVLLGVGAFVGSNYQPEPAPGPTESLAKWDSNQNFDPQVQKQVEQRSLVAIADREQKTVEALETGNFTGLSGKLKAALKSSHSKLREQLFANFRKLSKSNNGQAGLQAPPTPSAEELQRAKAKAAKLAKRRREQFNITKETVRVAVSQIGEKIRSKFQAKKANKEEVTSAPVTARNYTFEEMFIEHPDLFSLEDLKEITIQKRVKSIYVTHAIPPKPLISEKSKKLVPPVLLLHGAKFSSAVWDKTNTVQKIVDAGFHVYTVDLPGYGRSEGKVDAGLREVFLKGLINKLNLTKPFIVAPSMSGSFAVPYVRDFPKTVSGFMPIAATSLKMIPAATWNKIGNDTWIMYVYGEKDVDIGVPGAKFFKGAPNVDIFEMKQGTHPCYLDKPQQFNTKLLKWLMRASRSRLIDKNRAAKKELDQAKKAKVKAVKKTKD